MSLCLSSKETLPTPHIDTVLQQYRYRAVTDSTETSTDPHPPPPPTHPPGYELRLKQLESQLSDLLQRSKVVDLSDRSCRRLLWGKKRQ